MPFSRPTLSDLRTRVAQDIASALPGTDPLLRFSNLQVMGAVQAGMAHLQYGYLDWIAKQAVPFTAEGEYLEGWAALRGVYRLPATPASGAVIFYGTNGAVLPAGTALARGDGRQFMTTADGTVASGGVVVPVRAVPDPSGLTGAWGNTDRGQAMTLASAVVGVQSTGSVVFPITGGADIEQDEQLRDRMLLAYQTPARGGTAEDYRFWAMSVPGVTRAWCIPSGFGPGTVVVYIMLDTAQAAHGGFPQGANGVASTETRGVAATGDQLAVANYIHQFQPVTALVYVMSPTQSTVDFTLAGIADASAATKAAISAAIANTLVNYSTLSAGSTTVPLSYIQSAIAAIDGTAGFVITSPAANITSEIGAVPVLGTVTYTP